MDGGTSIKYRDVYLLIRTLTRISTCVWVSTTDQIPAERSLHSTGVLPYAFIRGRAGVAPAVPTALRGEEMGHPLLYGTSASPCALVLQAEIS